MRGLGSLSESNPECSLAADRLEPAELSARRRHGAELLRAAEPPADELAVLSTFNLDLLPPFLAEALDRHGVGARLWLAGFGQLAAEIANPDSELYRRAPGDVLLVPAPEDLLAPLYVGDRGADPLELATERVAELRGQVQTLLERLPGATIQVAVLGAERAPAEHLLGPSAPARGQAALAHLDTGIRGLGDLGGRVLMADFDWAARQAGRAALHDARLWYLGRMRLNPAGHALLADVVAGGLAVERGIRRRKVAAVDLDGTLWGGVVGEVGPTSVEVGEEGVALAFQDFQRELVRLHDSGVLIVLCSKNDPEYALAAFDHPSMVLRREHVVAERVNWRDKATNLRELADELDLGLESFVFLDDNPREREWIRQALPMVTVPELPADPTERPAFLARSPWFRTLAVTDADRSRSASYRAQGSRRRAQASAESFEDYLGSLEQRLTIEPVTEATVPRAAQLCQRTNQFNLTTRRHAQADIERMLADPAYDLVTLSVSDRFGDSGITGFAITRHADERAELDTLLLSCRLLGRCVEDAFLAALARRAHERGAHTLLGAYEPTDRNAQVADFLSDHGFTAAGERRWELDLENGLPDPPPQLTIEEAVHA
jgi:FkbH-like protein